MNDDAIRHEILHHWRDRKKQLPEPRWCKALDWMRKQGFALTGFGNATEMSGKGRSTENEGSAAYLG
ncbi:MAG TPA: hypothetical protein VGO67_15900 [Verrucomicrobiae bacterium]